MPDYKAPLRDMQFVYNELFDSDVLQSMSGFEELSIDLVDAMLDEAGKFCQQQLLPINQSGDEEGCHFVEGEVTTPTGFKEAYRDFCQMGLNSIALPDDYGGQNMPKTLALLIEEMVCSSNLSFSLYPGLTTGAATAMLASSNEELNKTWLPKMAAGDVTGAMALTEPHSGTDLGLLRTQAKPNDDGSYSITGTKIFITAGEHDLTDNIIHLVLARTPDAPKGIKGISMFLVPKYLLNSTGERGKRNGVGCGSIEHKMGINASSTCVINYESATGYLVGEINKGMMAMFVMMNSERLAVGIQGLGVAEAAYQASVTYARERLQGRSLTGARYPEKSADPIIVHPDVRKMLLTQRAYTEGGRALVVWIARELDIQDHHTSSERRNMAEKRVALMTPVIKAFLTDVGFECANYAVQIYGGHGYIKEYGVEQLVRDARIAQIYEGTNGVQAMDLAMRKLSINNGALPNVLFDSIIDALAKHREVPELQSLVNTLNHYLEQLQATTTYLQSQMKIKPDDVGAAANHYLRLTGLVTLGYLWLDMAGIALDNSTENEAHFYQAKLDTARFYYDHLLPQCDGLIKSIMAGSESLMNFNDDMFLQQ